MRSTLDAPAPPEANDLTAEQMEWQVLVTRIAASEVFARATQLREILLYVVHRSLHDTYPIKERDIACEVLKRPQNFDGTLDNIVRVQVGHLRRKLDQYFATEGKDEPLLIVVPRGSYIPRFEVRERPVEKPKETAPELEAATAVATAAAEREAERVAEQASSMATFRQYVPALAVAALVLAAVGITLAGLRLRAGAGVAATAATPAALRSANPVIRRIFSTDNSISVVTADTNLQLVQEILHREVSISEYSAPEYPLNLVTPQMPADTRAMLKLIATRRYTSFGDALVMLQCSEVARQYGKAIQLRYSRFINMGDLGQGNNILIGNSPWLSLFRPKLNFVPEEDPTTHSLGIRNRNPLPGELNLYPVIGNWSTESTSYVPIAMLPNLSHNGYVLVLNGTGMEATEAAMLFLTRPESADKLNQLLKGRELDEREPFELLLRVHSVQGTANDFEIIAVRSKTK